MKEMFRDGSLVFLTTPAGRQHHAVPGRRERSVAGEGLHFGWTIANKADLDDAAQQIERRVARFCAAASMSGHPFLYFTDPMAT